LLVVLRLSPFENDSEDVSSVAASLGLTLIYIGALMKMLEDVYKNTNNGAGVVEQDDRVNMSYVGIALDTLPWVCVGVVVGIVIVMDCGVYACCCKKKEKEKERGKKKEKGKEKGKREKKRKNNDNQHKEMKMSDVEDTDAQQSKTSGVKKTHILPAPTIGSSTSLEEEPDKRKRGGRGVIKRAKTVVVEL